MCQKFSKKKRLMKREKNKAKKWKRKETKDKYKRQKESIFFLETFHPISHFILIFPFIFPKQESTIYEYLRPIML